MLGFDIDRNFDWPYTKTNPSAFWNSWHMSLTHFFQRNVFVPFGGMREHTQYRAIFFTIMASRCGTTSRSRSSSSASTTRPG